MEYHKLFENTDNNKEAWLDLFLQVVDKHVPIKQYRRQIHMGDKIHISL